MSVRVCYVASVMSNSLQLYGLTSLVVQRVRSLPAMQEIQVQSLGWEDLLEKEMAPITLENPLDRGA